MLSKEEVLDDYEYSTMMVDYDDYVKVWERGCIELAMEKYAKQEAIAFAKWVAKNTIQEDSDKWVVNMRIDSELRYHNTEELYLLYQQSLNNK